MYTEGRKELCELLSSLLLGLELKLFKDLMILLMHKGVRIYAF